MKTYSRVNEELGIDFIRCGENKSTGVFTVENSHREGVVELSSVHVHASPGSGLVEGVKVLGVVEKVEEADDFQPLLLIENGEDLSLGEHTALVQRDEVLDSFDILGNKN